MDSNRERPMAGRWDNQDDFSGDDDRDAPQPIDLDDDGNDDDTIDCPHCGRPVYEDAPRCPHCGRWVEDDPSPATSRSRSWFWPITVALLVAAILVLWHGLGR